MIKSVKNIFLSCMLLLCAVSTANAQELNCQVEVNSDQVQATNRDIFTTLQEEISSYMNTTKFTGATFATNEKIECRLFFTITDYTDNTLKGTLQVQAIRPVYNSTYTTNLLNFKDNKIEFTYQEHEPLVFNTTSWENNLTSILNFYAYLILAIDFDSFSPLGGQAYFDQLQNIVQLAQSSGEIGWKVFEDNRNRAALLASFTDPSTQGIRNLIYTYHRKGLDEMSVSPDKGRANITQTMLENIGKIAEAAPMSVALTMFHDSKLDELINIYSKGSQTERDDVYNLLYKIYPTEQSRLNNIKNPPQR